MDPSGFWPQTFIDWLFVAGHFITAIVASVTIAWAFVKDKLNGFGDRLNDAEKDITRNSENVHGLRDRVAQTEYDVKKFHDSIGRMENALENIVQEIRRGATAYEKDARQTIAKLSSIETELKHIKGMK